MAEYIERERARREFAIYFRASKSHAEDCDNLLCYLPTADVVEVRHGEWIDNRNGTFTCSVCGGQSSKMDWCGRCGAKMDGKGEGE